MDNFFDLLQYGFARRAFAAGAFTALSCALLGIFLVPRRFSMIGDGLAHFAFLAVGLGVLMRINPMLTIIPMLMLASVGILHLPQKAALFGDAAIGMTATTGLAAGVILASMADGFNIDLFSYLFGDILAVGRYDLIISCALTVIVVGTILLRYHELLAVTFDRHHAGVLGIRPDRIDRMLALLTALTVAIAIKVAGMLLLSSLLIFPAAAALQVAGGFRWALLISAALGVGTLLAGMMLAFTFDLPTGAAIALLNALAFGICWTIRQMRR